MPCVKRRHSMASKISKQIKRLLASNTSLSIDSATGKVKCSLTNHEMPQKEDAINTYLSGKKYRKAKNAQYAGDHEHKQFLEPSSKRMHKNQLFCKISLRHLNNEPSHIEKHLNGRRFKKAHARWLECQKNGTKFLPRIPQKRQQQDEEGGPSGAGSGGGSDSEDSMTDLMPDLHDVVGADEEGQGEGSDSDFEFDEAPAAAATKEVTKPSVSQKTSKNKPKNKQKKKKNGTKSVVSEQKNEDEPKPQKANKDKSGKINKAKRKQKDSSTGNAAPKKKKTSK